MPVENSVWFGVEVVVDEVSLETVLVSGFLCEGMNLGLFSEQFMYGLRTMAES